MALRFFGARSVMLGVGTLAAAVAAMAGAPAPAHAALGIACPYPTSTLFDRPLGGQHTATRLRPAATSRPPPRDGR